jgi:predicted transcriptional regulator
MLRVDAAATSRSGSPARASRFSRFGGTCPRWNLHAAFQTPGRIATQIVETPDGQRFFTVSRTVERAIRLDPRESSQLAIGLGCDVKHAPAWSMPTASILPTPMSPRSAQPVLCVRARAARSAPPRRPAGR